MIRFLTTKEDEELPTFVITSVEEKYKNLWGKTREGFRRAYEELYEDIDWVIKADDDTFVVMENLRYLLSDQDASQPVWFGCEFKVIVKDGGYMSGGAGYVLSKGAIRIHIIKQLKRKKIFSESLRRFATEALLDPAKCKTSQDQGMEDVEMGKCLKNVGVTDGDSRDNLGRSRFVIQKIRMDQSKDHLDDQVPALHPRHPPRHAALELGRVLVLELHRARGAARECENHDDTLLFIIYLGVRD